MHCFSRLESNQHQNLLVKLKIKDLMSSKRIHQLHCCSSHNVSAFPSASALKVINGKNTYIIQNLIVYLNNK